MIGEAVKVAGSAIIILVALWAFCVLVFSFGLPG